MLILHRPYKLVRKVIVEKTSNVNYELKDINPMNTRRNISIIISIITTIIFNYTSMCFISLETNIVNWLLWQRVIFLTVSIIGTFLVMFYCSNHMLLNERGDKENEKIMYLSENWFKKLLTMFVFYLFSIGIVFLVISFCTMNLDFTKTTVDSRSSAYFVVYICFGLLCSACYWNLIPFILKFDKQ